MLMRFFKNLFKKLFKKQRGQTILELLLASPLYFLMLMGIWFFAKFYVVELTMENVSRAVAWMPVYAEQPNDYDASDMEDRAETLIDNWLGKYVGSDMHSDSDGQVVVENIETARGKDVMCELGGCQASMPQMMHQAMRMESMAARFGMLDDCDCDQCSPYSKAEIAYKFKIFDSFRDGIGWMGINLPEWDLEWIPGGTQNYVTNSFWENSQWGTCAYMIPMRDPVYSDMFYCSSLDEHPEH